VGFRRLRAHSHRPTPLDVEGALPCHAIWDLAVPGSVANLYSAGSSQHRPGVVARRCRPSPLPHPRAAGGDKPCCCCLVVLHAVLEVEGTRHSIPYIAA
jgi:hypothetical protein